MKYISKTQFALCCVLISGLALSGCGLLSTQTNLPQETTTNVVPNPTSSQIADNTIVLKIDSTTMIVNGTSRTIPASPVIREGRTLVPVRVVSEAMSASVYWLEKTKQIRIVEGGNEIILTIGSKEMKIGGMTKTMDVEPMIIGGSTYVPLRFISENLGAEIAWNDATREITITR
ncbi:MAG TPA: hypothetical protein DIT32_06955 [Peptococcaceae bacterium]|nr:hypothetical protein [Peptococcaceae bacterium]